jgi:hypothetical protein
MFQEACWMSARFWNPASCTQACKHDCKHTESARLLETRKENGSSHLGYRPSMPRSGANRKRPRGRGRRVCFAAFWASQGADVGEASNERCEVDTPHERG